MADAVAGQRRIPSRALAVGAWLTWLVCSVVHWSSAAPLGHDEARYAIAGSDLLAGDDSRWEYVPPGMEVIAIPGVAVGGSERALRLLPLALSALFLGVLWCVARNVGSAETAAWTIALAAATGPLVRLSSDLLSDIPSTALLLGAAWIVFREVTRPDGPTASLVWASPLAAGAFYIRYGSCIPLAIIAALSVLAAPRAIARRPAIVVAAVAIFVALLVPHFIRSQLTTGSLLGTLRSSATVPKGFGKGIAEYAAHPVQYLGPFTLVLLPAAIRFGANTRLRAMLLTLAFVDVLSLGIQTSAQARYVYLATSLILIIGPIGLSQMRFASGALTKAIRIAARLAVLAVVIGWSLQLVAAFKYRAVRIKGMTATILAASAIRDDVNGAPCYVLGRHDTQLEWYTHCEYRLVLPERIDKPLYAVWDNTGGPWQPDLGALPQPRRDVVRVPGVVEVVRVR